jgi:riboflavin synthase
MFTGIIEETGTITAMEPRHEAVELTIACIDTIRGAKPGDSIAVDGICLTVTGLTDASFTTFASHETLRRTNLAFKAVGDRVNLEAALTLGKMLGGHLVQGHVDGVGSVAAIMPEGDSQMWRFGAPKDITKYLVCKGSVAVDGISLTVVDVLPDGFTVAIIPKTIDMTTFQFRKPGDPVNLEADIIGKYVYRFVHPDEAAGAADPASETLEALRRRGLA